MRQDCTVMSAATSIAWATAALAGTLHVPADYSTIQSCIDAAVSGQDECVVAPGVYNETIDFLGKAITLRSSLGRDVTTIDAAGIGGSVVTCASAEGPGTILRGFTLTGGTGTLLPSRYVGGGMYNDGSAPTVDNCTFSANTATYGGGMFNHDASPTLTACMFSQNSGGGAGGGISNDTSAPTTTDCVFSENTASVGGAIYNEASHPTVAGCTFSDNVGDLGGAIFNQSSHPAVLGSTFVGNSAEQGGGMYNVFSDPLLTSCMFSANSGASGAGGAIYNYTSNPTIADCTFDRNVAEGLGGAMSNYGISHPRVTNCSFVGNTAGFGGGMGNDDSSEPTVTGCRFSGNIAIVYGGGMFNDRVNPTVTHCAFSGNSAYFGGGMFTSGGTVANCTFGGNTASYGGGVYTRDGGTVANCTLSGNTASSYGGGMFTSGGGVVINSTFSGNTAVRGGGVYDHDGDRTVANCVLWGDIPDEIVNNGASAPIIRFSDIQDGLPVGAVDGGGDFNFAPTFIRPPNPGSDGQWDGVDDDYGDLRLEPGSPCINAGDPEFVPAGGEADLDSHARVLCDRVDIGAYEFGIGDLDCNQSVDLADFAGWDECMMGPTPGESPQRCEVLDFNADGDVDLLDLAQFENAYSIAP